LATTSYEVLIVANVHNEEAELYF